MIFYFMIGYNWILKAGRRDLTTLKRAFGEQRAQRLGLEYWPHSHFSTAVVFFRGRAGSLLKVMNESPTGSWSFNGNGGPLPRVLKPVTSSGRGAVGILQWLYFGIDSCAYRS